MTKTRLKETEKIEGTEENWENRTLGADENFVAIARKTGWQENDAEELGLKSISIRLQVKLLDELKMIAEINSIGYQPLIKQVLHRFVEAEMKNLLKEAAIQARKEKCKSADSPEECEEEALINYG